MLLSALGLAAAAGAAGGLYGWALERHSVRLSRHSIAVPGLAGDLRLLHLSDLHLGRPGRTEAHLRARCASLAPDLTVVTGDLAGRHGRLADLIELVAALAGRAPVAAVWGNLERWERRDLTNWRRRLEAAGWIVFENEGRLLRLAGDVPLYVAGTDDPHFRYADAGRALAGAPAGAPRLLLAHSPDVLHDPASAAADLVLAGHTHGGQIRLPGLPPLLTGTAFHRRAAAGLFARGRQPVFVSRGIGTALVPIRFCCPPEAALLELTPGGPAAVHSAL